MYNVNNRPASAAGSRDDRICAVLTNLHEVACAELGFARRGTRADNQVELRTPTGVRLVLWTNYVHGEGRIIVEQRGQGGAIESRREIRISGLLGVREETRLAQRALFNLVRRAGGEGAELDQEVG